MSPTRPKVHLAPLALVAENSCHTRDMYAEWLVFSGFRVAEAATADEAMEKALRLRAKVIMTDVRQRRWCPPLSDAVG